MAGVWEREIEQLLRRQRRSAKVKSRVIRERRKAVATALEALGRAEDALLRDLKGFETTSQKLLARREDPEVVVRNYNPTTIYVYHADTACGWVRDESRTERILLSDAEDLNYHPCASCGYRVAKRAKQAAAA